MKEDRKLQDFRRQYELSKLEDDNLLKGAYELFTEWFKLACERIKIDPQAMTLATVDAQGQPKLRIVLLKEHSFHQFVFYSNYESAKGLELQKNPLASLLFYWPDLERQVRIEGEVVRLEQKDSESYFASRPRKSQLAAWASKQSRELKFRQELDEAYLEFEKKYAKQKVPCPPHWGGFCLKACRYEFWQGRENRLHDRIEYFKDKKNWQRRRLAP